MLWTAMLVTTLGGGMPGAPGGRGPDEVLRTEHLSVHSDPWMNLHHFLYQWARAEAGLGTGRQAVPVPERDELDALDAEERSAWQEAVAYYGRELAERDYLFDDLMLRLKWALAGLDGDTDVVPPDDPPGVGAALSAAMPVYLAHWWPRHDRANRAWIAGQRGWIERHEAAYVTDVERAYGGVWSGVLRVDVAAYANWAGGYTSNGPNHTVMASTDEGLEGLYGLETLFHEAGHQSELESALIGDLGRAFAASGREQPGNLWHAILFHTAGWITQRVARAEGLPEHEPYAVHEGLVNFRSWSGLWPLLEEHWRPFLEGRTTREEALRGLAGG